MTAPKFSKDLIPPTEEDLAIERNEFYLTLMASIAFAVFVRIRWPHANPLAAILAGIIMFMMIFMDTGFLKQVRRNERHRARQGYISIRSFP